MFKLSARFVHKDNMGEWFILNAEESIRKILQRFNDVTKRKKKEDAEAAAEEEEARIATEEEEARIAAEEESDFDTTIDIEALLQSPTGEDAQLQPRNDVAEATIGVNEASGESHERQSPTAFLFADSNPTSTTGGNVLAQGHESAPALMGSTLPLTIGDPFAQGHESAPALMGSAPPPTSTIGNPFAQGHESTPNPTGDVLSRLPTGSSSATDDDPMNGIHLPFPEHTDPATSLLDGLDQHAPHPEDQDELSTCMELDDIHQYAV